MMLNAGVHLTKTGDITTKRRLKQLATEHPHLVTYYLTSPFDKGKTRAYTLDKLEHDVTLVVTGPDPFTNRAWHANVKREAVSGKVRVT